MSLLVLVLGLCLYCVAAQDDILVQSGVSVPNVVVGTRQWKYFHLTPTKVPASVVVNVLTTSNGGDLDVYIRLGSMPTKTEYLHRDITSSRNVTIHTRNVNEIIYLGVYGYITATATVTMSLKSTCPNDCSGAGTCGNDGLCSCLEGHAGRDCSVDVILLGDKQVVSTQVNIGQWKFFQAIHEEGQHELVEFIISQKIPYPQQDCNIYVKYGGLPSLNSYDFRDVSNKNQYKISITDAKAGKYFAGVHGNKACEFNITLFLRTPECPNKCSGPTHGTCDSLSYKCTCNSNFAGESCNTMVPTMGFGAPVSGYVGDNAWNFYTVNTFSSGNALVTLRQQPQEGIDTDCDMYIARSRIPTFIDFDFRDISFSTNYSIMVVGSGVNTWKIGVHGYSSCSYTLETTLVRTCLNGCTDSDHGTCMDGTCNCRVGWSGSDCSVAMLTLENGKDYLGSVQTNQWKYYQYTVQPGTTATVFVKESLSTGYIWLFANHLHLSSPSLFQNDAADTDIGKAVHSIKLSATNTPSTYIIGVYANALSVPNTPYEFSLVAWQPVF